MNTEIKNHFVHESSYVDEDCEIGENTNIWHFCHIISGTVIGERCNIGQNVVIGGNVKVGNGCKIQNNVSIYEGVELEDDVFCGPSMVFTNVFTPRSHVSRKSEYLPTPVRKGATANATIVCGNEIGAFAFIGAGAVVTKKVPSQALMVGNPAVQIGWMCKCGERLPTSYNCGRCGANYEIDDELKIIKEV